MWLFETTLMFLLLWRWKKSAFLSLSFFFIFFYIMPMPYVLYITRRDYLSCVFPRLKQPSIYDEKLLPVWIIHANHKHEHPIFPEVVAYMADKTHVTHCPANNGKMHGHKCK